MPQEIAGEASSEDKNRVCPGFREIDGDFGVGALFPTTKNENSCRSLKRTLLPAFL
jgi:hypothetical protein